MRKFVVAFLVCFFLSLATTVAKADLIGPTPYTSAANSPFTGLTFTYFHLENFEDHLFNTPGVTANAGGVTSVVFGPDLHDSVDADDGAIDGNGLQGDSFFSSSGGGGITFTFNAAVLGSLPTHVGIVWTDGSNPIFFEAFGPGGSLGTLTGTHADGSISGETGEDRFYGVFDTGGISSIFISNGGSGIEVDHLQYGRISQVTPTNPVPEPTTMLLLGTGLAGVGAAVRKRRKARDTEEA